MSFLAPPKPEVGRSAGDGRTRSRLTPHSTQCCRLTVRVAVGVVEKDGRVLLTQRRPDGLLGGLWEFPGGKIEDGEKPHTACAREILEETGLSVEVAERIAYVKHAYTHFKVEIDVYRCRFRGGAVVLDGPVDYRWVSVDDVRRLPLPKASHKILPHLEKKR